MKSLYPSNPGSRKCGRWENKLREKNSFWVGTKLMGTQDWQVKGGGRGTETGQNIIVK